MLVAAAALPRKFLRLCRGLLDGFDSAWQCEFFYILHKLRDYKVKVCNKRCQDNSPKNVLELMSYEDLWSPGPERRGQIARGQVDIAPRRAARDRKSTRLNSSHVKISYA